MMRNALYLLILSMLVLTACGGGSDGNDDDGGDGNTSGISAEDLILTIEAEDEEVVDVPQDDDTADLDTSPEPRLTVDPDAVTTFSTPDPNDPPVETFVAPPIGVLGEAATEEVAPGVPTDEQDARTDFDYIYFEQTLLVQIDPRVTETLILEVYGDGRVIVDGDVANPINVSRAELTVVAQHINDVNFFYMQNTFISGVPQAEGTYRYRMAVVRGDLERAIQAEDGFMPPEIQRLLGAVRGLAEQIPNPFPQVESPTEEGS